MALYLSEWKYGYEIFREFSELAWEPYVECCLTDFDPNQIKAAVYFLSVDAVQALAEQLDGDTRKSFVARFNSATTIILEMLNVKKFIQLNFTEALSHTDDVDAANEALNVAFQQFILEYEFWNKVNVLDMYANLIFYGTLDDPKPVFFAIPPMDQWNTKYRFGWAGYPHTINSD